MIRSLVRRLLNERQRYLLGRRIWDLKAFPLRNDLTALARYYGTDKAGRHHYTSHYELHFRGFRDRKILLFEIGVGGYEDPRHGGHSLRMWKRYFPKARIVSMDLHEKSWVQEPRITIYQGDQTDRMALDRIVEENGRPDIIIDDGSHINSHVIGTFVHLFPKLKHGGYYVVEDTQTSYWPEYGGSSQLDAPGTLKNYFKARIDGLDHIEFRHPYTPNELDRHIVAMHFYHNLIFIRKGLNNGSAGL